MITIERTFDPSIGLQQIDILTGYIFTPEESAHTFVISRKDNPFLAADTVECRFIKDDKVTEYVEGSVVDGAAVVTLRAECYQVPGKFTMVILVTENGTKTCVYAATSTAIAGDTPNVHVADGTARMIDDLIDGLNDAEAAALAKIIQVQNAVTAAQSSVDGIEAQKNTIIAAIASVAGQGTDTTFHLRRGRRRESRW